MVAAPEAAYYALLEVFIFLAVAELLHSFARKVGVPTLVSDLLLGVLLSSFALGGILNSLIGVPIFLVNDYVLLFADFSVILLLFAAGLGGGFAGLRRAGTPAVLAAIAGDLVPFALALVVFSGWRCGRLLGGAYFFGLFMTLELYAKASGFSFLPSQFWASMPYLMAILVLAAMSARARGGSEAPACLGKPFIPDA